MQFGHFDDENREYVITRPDTPRSWSNYLGSTEYGAIITNNAGGYSFFRSAAMGRFTRLRFNAVPMDQPGRLVYLRDRQDGDFWSASWQPVGKPLTQYRSTCRHGTAYTVIASEYAGIRAETTYFVPLGQRFEYWVVKLTNPGPKTRKLSLFTYVEYSNDWCAYEDLIDLQFTQHTGKGEFADGILTHSVLNRQVMPHLGVTDSHDVFISLTGAPLCGFDSDREAFLGPYRGYDRPLAVEEGRCRNSLSDGDNSCGVLQADVDIAPDETKTIVIIMGLGLGETVGKKVMAEFGRPETAEAELRKLKHYWHGQLGKFAVRTPDAAFNSMLNVWNPFNCLITYAWSRSASLVYSGERNGLGFRDTVQDILAVLPAIAGEARPRLELMLTGQYSTGGAKPVIVPFEHKAGAMPLPDKFNYRSDDCLWFFNTVPEYVKETGDLEFFRKVLPYGDTGEDTVLAHMKRAIEFNLNHVGRNGLPCGLNADWNDCIHWGPRGESVFLSLQLRNALSVYIDICRLLEIPEEAHWAERVQKGLDGCIQRAAWDGDWFLRGIHQDGKKLGSHSNPENSIFIEPQPWAVISGAAPREQAIRAMDSMREHLATPYGIMISAPPGPHIINPGQKENCGIFCHTQGWAVMAECMLGRGDRAWEYYKAYMPSAYNDRAEVRQIEPYVHCQSTHSKFSRQFGASRLPWLSGTAAWSYYSATQYILGIRPEYHGLRIDPCLPREWPEVAVTRIFRGRRFDITVRNGPKGKGVRQLTVNGFPLQGDLVPENVFQEENQVEVELF